MTRVRKPGFLARLRQRFSFPLLVKELTETSARRRTYTMRCVYALLLYAFFALMVPSYAWSGQNGWSSLGTGGQMFESLLILQFAGVALFLPALMCGRITQEKERDSLTLLFLTDLSPWSIVLQKYFGGLLLMLSFFLLSLPLAGVAYAYGGVDSTSVIKMLSELVLTLLQVGAAALLCSTWCRSTVGAFISTYFLLLFFYAGPPLCGALLRALAPEFTDQIDIDSFAFLLIPPAAIEGVGSSRKLGWWAIAPSILSIAVFLIGARRNLVRRATVPASTFVRRLFDRIDSTMKRLNRATGGVVIWHRDSDLPTDDPIFWRETRRRALGRPNYLVRILLVAEVPTLLFCGLAALAGPNYPSQYYGFTVILAILGVLVALVISAQAANTIVSERVTQTLEVLLTTALSAREIIRQKERALYRLLIVIAIPLLTVVFCEWTFEEGIPTTQSDGSTVYLTCSILNILLYLPLIAWLSLWIGLRVRTRFQAIVVAVGTWTFWAALSPLTVYLITRFDRGSYYSQRWLLTLISPATVAAVNETGELTRLLKFTSNPWQIVAANGLLYTAIALFVRWRLYADAERFLRR